MAALVDALATDLERVGMQVSRVSPTMLAFSAPASANAPIGVAGVPSIGFVERGEVEVLASRAGTEVVLDVRVSRQPSAAAFGMLAASAMLGGLHALPVTVGLLVGGIVALVPWWIVRARMIGIVERARRHVFLSSGATFDYDVE